MGTKINALEQVGALAPSDCLVIDTGSATKRAPVSVLVAANAGAHNSIYRGKHLGSAVAALPANVFSIWMNFSGSVLASFWSRHPVVIGKTGRENPK